MEIFGADFIGIDGHLIKLSATRDEDVAGVRLLGLAQKVVKEGYQRAAKAIETLTGSWGTILQNSGYTIQLSLPEISKNSSGLDLPLAIMLLNASVLQSLDSLSTNINRLNEKISKSKTEKQIHKENMLKTLEHLVQQRETALKYRSRLANNTNKYLLIGTLNISDGSVSSPPQGMFNMISAANNDFTVIISEDTELHGALIGKIKNTQVFVVKNLQETWDIILGIKKPRKANYRHNDLKIKNTDTYIPDINAIQGVSKAKRAMLIALAGGHNILLVGPPGQGKTMLASASTNLLPDMSTDEIFDVNKIYSVKGELLNNELVRKRPFVSVSCDITEQALFGGMSTSITPGLISLAHNGILLFDEINLFPSKLIEMLRTTMSNKYHTVQRSKNSIRFPSNFIMVASMNPCKCGWFGHKICPTCNEIFFIDQKFCNTHTNTLLKTRCSCSQFEINTYKNKLSKPLLDRIDLKVILSSYDTTNIKSYTYASSTSQRDIQLARRLQEKRFQNANFGNSNACVPDDSQFTKYSTPLSSESKNYFKSVYNRFKLTRRTEVKLKLVAQTIADFSKSETILPTHINEAVDLMGINNFYFYDLFR